MGRGMRRETFGGWEEVDVAKEIEEEQVRYEVKYAETEKQKEVRQYLELHRPAEGECDTEMCESYDGECEFCPQGKQNR